jgi:transcriptional regulator GlxA family with amidase domain
VLFSDTDGRLGMTVRWLWELTVSGEPLDSGLCVGLLQGVLSELNRLRGGTESQMVQAVRVYILDRLSEPMQLDDLARVAGMSRYHFSRVFKTTTGETPMAYVRRLRVEAARGLLLTTPLSLRAIAAQVGFPDEFQFSRVFKKLTGQAPGSLR